MAKHDKKRKPVTNNKKETEERRGPKVGRIVIPLVLLVYLVGVIAFHKVFVFHTTFNGENFSLKSPEAIDQAMEEDTNNRVITLKEIDGEETISLSQELDYVKTAIPPEKGWIDKITPWIWPKYIFAKNQLKGTVNVDYSREKLDEAIGSLNALQPENMRAPKDAYLGRDGDVYVIVPEDDGNQIIKENLMAIFENYITESDEEIDLDAVGCYTKAAIRSDNPDLVATYEKYKAANFQKITIDMTGATEVLETPDIIAMWDENGPSKDKIREYVYTLRDKYDTYEEQRPFVTSYGNEIMVGSRTDTYGFLIDVEGTVEAINTAMASKAIQSIAPVWQAVGWTRTANGGDIGHTYIEVSIDSQMLWAYYNGELVRTAYVVSGLMDKFDTPRGVYSVLLKKTDTFLEGEEEPGGKKWKNHVDFWMALTWSGIGLHNADWRSEFGGGIYQWGGSHGCVNMDYDDAEYLYNTFGHGTPVVIW